MKRLIASMVVLAGMWLSPATAATDDMKAPEGYAFSGAVTDSVRVRNIKRTTIVDDNTILFFMTGKKIYANIMTHRCAGLVRENRFAYEVRVGQLTSLDVITVFDTFGVSNHCGLGKFYEVTKINDEMKPEN